MRWLRITLILVAVVCFGVALSYPIRYRMAQESNNSNMEQLSALRAKGQSAIEEAEPTPGERDGSDGEVEADSRAETKLPESSGESEEEPMSGADASASGTEEISTSVTGESGGATESEGANAEVPLPSDAAQEASARGSGETGPTEAIPGQAGTDKAGLDEGAAEGGVFDEEPADVGAETTGEATGADEGAAKDHFTGATGAESLTEADWTKAVDDGSEATVVAAAAPEEAIVAPEEAAGLPMTPEPTSTPVPTPSPTPGLMDLILGFPQTPSPTDTEASEDPAAASSREVTPQPSPTPNRRIRTGALPYPMLEKVAFDPDAILPELQEIYELNHDLVGWLTIPDTVIDYPVVQAEDSLFYLEHDFYGEENINGQIILDTLCDPYTPSYNLVISGHHMKNGSMFGDLPKYASKGYWASHKFLEFDTLMARKQYVIFAAFYSADYDEDEEGFRYNADIQYEIDANQWLAEVRENQLYDTEIDVAFGDEFITLTTCNRARHKNGRFVVVCRRIREGETFE